MSEVMKIIFDLWKKHLTPSLEHLWESLLFWRIGAIFLITVVAFEILLRKKIINFLLRTKKQEHDKLIFEASNKILPEKHLITVLDELQTTDSYKSSQVQNIDRFCEYFREVGNQYRTRILKKKTKEIVTAIKELRRFQALNFFVYPEEQQDKDFQLCLQPNLNIERNGTAEGIPKYDELQKELDKLCKNAREKYREYRTEIKFGLNI